jgi:hypothetical protein
MRNEKQTYDFVSLTHCTLPAAGANNVSVEHGMTYKSLKTNRFNSLNF